MNYILSNKAQTDLESIWLYTFDNWSIEQADRYYNLLLDEIEILSQHPNLGIDSSYIRKDYFRSKVKSHFIFYKINKSKNQIEIIRILHEKMDIENILGNNS